jgi:hypothetical protein
MKIYPIQFNRLPYYKHLQVAHVFDTMHISKNVIESLWRMLDERSNKDKNFKVCSDIQENNHAMQNLIQYSSSDGQVDNLLWLFKSRKTML